MYSPSIKITPPNQFNFHKTLSSESSPPPILAQSLVMYPSYPIVDISPLQCCEDTDTDATLVDDGSYRHDEDPNLVAADIPLLVRTNPSNMYLRIDAIELPNTITTTRDSNHYNNHHNQSAHGYHSGSGSSSNLINLSPNHSPFSSNDDFLAISPSHHAIQSSRLSELSDASPHTPLLSQSDTDLAVDFGDNMDTLAVIVPLNDHRSSSNWDLISPFALIDDVIEDDDEDTSDMTDAGYRVIRKITDTLQGAIYECENKMSRQRVAIKKADKQLHYQHEAKIRRESVEDDLDDGMCVIVEEDIVKEAAILKHLTCDNLPIADNICLFIDFFETETDYYLVTEYCGDMTLNEFVKQAHDYVNNKKLSLKDWRSMTKFIFWQITVILYWLHHDMKCCHLDLTMDNIMVKNAKFVLNEQTGEVSIDRSICVKLVDFGLSEVFRTSSAHGNMNQSMECDDGMVYLNAQPFSCAKYGITEYHHLKTPNLFNGDVYNARKADVYSLGILLYFMVVGHAPYEFQCSDKCPRFGLLEQGKLGSLLKAEGAMNHVNKHMAFLLKSMLTIDEDFRCNIADVITNEWINVYYQKYERIIAKKSVKQQIQLKKMKHSLAQFPYYDICSFMV